MIRLAKLAKEMRLVLTSKMAILIKKISSIIFGEASAEAKPEVSKIY